MSERKKISDQTFAVLWNCHKIGTETIARELGVTRQAVSWRARHLGLPSRAKRRRKKVDDALFTEMWHAGVCVRGIARHFGLAQPSCCSQVVKRLGLPRRERSSGGVGGPGGWPKTISLDDYQQEILGRLMAETVKGRHT